MMMFFIIPKPDDDDKNWFHDKSKSVKVEVTCDSDEDMEEEAAAASAIPMGPVKPRLHKRKTAVKGLYVCEICGLDYVNKSDFTNHMQQHEGVTFTCTQCEKVFYLQKGFDNHAKAHQDGLHECPQCSQKFELKSSLTNHIKSHTNVYVCECPECGKEAKSYAMHLEHINYVHTETPTIPCDYCHCYFFTPTQMYCHCNKEHGPAPHNVQKV